VSEPLWCDIRQQHCRCHDYGRRCEDYANDYAEQMIRREQAELYNGRAEHDMDTTGNPLKAGR
jgi:hypothetical protein